MLVELTKRLFSNLSDLWALLGFYSRKPFVFFFVAVLDAKDKNHSVHTVRSGGHQLENSWCLCMLMLGRGTRQVERDLLLVVLLWLVSMMAMIRSTCNRQAHHLHGSSTIPPVWRRKRVFRNSIGGVHCTLAVLIFSPFLWCSFHQKCMVYSLWTLNHYLLQTEKQYFFLNGIFLTLLPFMALRQYHEELIQLDSWKLFFHLHWRIEGCRGW